MRAQRGQRVNAMDRVVDIGFAVLLIVCGIRYFSRHPLEGEGSAALVLAIGTGVSYAIAVIGRRSPQRDPRTAGLEAVGSRQAIGLLVSTGFWLPLAVLAPSFGWCGFALFFAVHRVIRGRLAIVISTAIVVAVSTGLLIMSKGDDLGLVLGPFFGGLVLTYAYTALDRALEAQRTLNAQLVETREQLARSERDAGALAERERVASELHDTVVQRTATALLMLESDDLRGGEQSAVVGEARDALREGLVQTRQLLHGLADPREHDVPLAAALESQARAAGAEFVMVGDERTIPDAISHALTRVVQEALLNSRKHAQATWSRVTLTFFDAEVGVDVADDGIGFTAREADSATIDSESGGFGIRAMTWRIENLDGALTIESYPDEGTIVSAIVPDAAHDGGTP